MTLKEKLTSKAVFPLPQSKGHLAFETEALDKQIGFVLIRDQSDRTNTKLWYWLRALIMEEQNYDTSV